MSRSEFRAHVRRAARTRSGGHCEANGKAYGLAEGTRCAMPLDRGVEFDHVLPDGLGGEPTLENCLCVCKRCHDFKTRKGDIPRIAKMKRQRDYHIGLKPKSRLSPAVSGMRKRMNGQAERKVNGRWEAI